MREKLSASLQNTLKWLVPLLLIFAIFYAVSETKQRQVVVLSDDKTSAEIVEELNDRGYFANGISYFILKLAVKAGFDIESGGFSLEDKMGPFSMLAALASPEYKYVAINEGLRKEEVAEIFAEKLNWDEKKKQEFAENYPICLLDNLEGYFFPGKYLVHKNDSVYEIRNQMEEKLNETVEEIVETKYSTTTEGVLNLEQIITIASLIQREAAGKNDMKLISGIIWNRIFNDMPLQIDATLQYVKGSDENGWWPPVRADDKYLESPYNTYQEDGLPPGPISNPGKAAIEAALSPNDTKCLFYLHDRNRVIHCATTYDAHKRNVSYYLK